MANKAIAGYRLIVHICLNLRFERILFKSNAGHAFDKHSNTHALFGRVNALFDPKYMMNNAIMHCRRRKICWVDGDRGGLHKNAGREPDLRDGKGDVPPRALRLRPASEHRGPFASAQPENGPSKRAAGSSFNFLIQIRSTVLWNNWQNLALFCYHYS